MRHIILILALIGLTACNESGGGAQTASAPADLIPPSSDPADPGLTDPGSNDPVSNPVQTPQTVTVSYFALTRTIAPSASYPSVTFDATAYCLEYENRQFCWDDGLHTTNGGPFPFKDNYFGFQASPTTGNMQACKLSCADDYFSEVREVTNRRNFMLTVLGGNLGQEVDHILNSGTEMQTSCTLDGSTLTCGNLVVNL